ncbi:McrB family protein [Flavobacterium sp.]|jgi:hypothetical protein|uniref:McrB family protein n=1 Tax=Flavobacterium sp. TaxID=239 RepID=UPI0037BEE297
MLDKFIKWLEVNKPKSIRHYTSGYNTINKICHENDLMLLEEWDNKNWKKNYEAIILINEFKELNSSGNNILTATLSNYKKLIMEKTSTINIPPVIPFPEFKWRWAVTTPSESLNTEELLFGVLAILVKHNGKRHATQEFKNDLLELQNRTGTSIDLAKIDRDINKNIIENSGQYWKALGLLNSTTDGTISVTDLGKGIVNSKISKLDFIKKLYNDFSLPNSNIESTSTISIWNKNKIVVHPFKIIINILLGLSKRNQSPTNWYIEAEELRDVIIPLSIYKDLDIDVYVDFILKYRNDKSQFSSWPNCAPGDNDFRMIKEYLIFLSNFKFLDLIELKDKSKRYYINSSTLSVIDDIIIFNKDYKISNKTKHINLNKIYFGPPGTGKSHAIKEYLKKLNTAKENYSRVTFHPDYDYHSFVGGYKPYTDINDNDKIKYKFVPQIFTELYIKAWSNQNENYFLVIEEINRGNCSEIFGDIFQLLDRNPEYNIEPSTELREYLLLEEKRINSERIKNGEEAINLLINGKLEMPDNLSILASMNTSDQSLYPMDSAFKRRWEWEYVPIHTKCGKSNFVIKIKEDKTYSWLDFIDKVNSKIYSVTKSEDKQIGNWFIDATSSENIISKELFVNKVLFYLWNDVFKDDAYNPDNIFVQKNDDGTKIKDLSFNDFHKKETQDDMLIHLFEKILGLGKTDVKTAEPKKYTEQENTISIAAEPSSNENDSE